DHERASGPVVALAAGDSPSRPSAATAAMSSQRLSVFILYLLGRCPATSQLARPPAAAGLLSSALCSVAVLGGSPAGGRSFGGGTAGLIRTGRQGGRALSPLVSRHVSSRGAAQVRFLAGLLARFFIRVFVPSVCLVVDETGGHG